jgi:presenilin-like A22 family membrane protease
MPSFNIQDMIIKFALYMLMVFLVINRTLIFSKIRQLSKTTKSSVFFSVLRSRPAIFIPNLAGMVIAAGIQAVAPNGQFDTSCLWSFGGSSLDSIGAY